MKNNYDERTPNGDVIRQFPNSTKRFEVLPTVLDGVAENGTGIMAEEIDRVPWGNISEERTADLDDVEHRKRWIRAVWSDFVMETLQRQYPSQGSGQEDLGQVQTPPENAPHLDIGHKETGAFDTWTEEAIEAAVRRWIEQVFLSEAMPRLLWEAIRSNRLFFSVPTVLGRGLKKPRTSNAGTPARSDN